MQDVTAGGGLELMSEMEWMAPSVIIDLEEQEANCGNGHGLEVG